MYRRKADTIEKSWNVVTNNGRNQTQPKSLQNSTSNEMPVGKPPINKKVISYSAVNRYEILGDSDSNGELSDANKKPSVAHNEVTTRQEKVGTNKGAITKSIPSKEKRRIA